VKNTAGDRLLKIGEAVRKIKSGGLVLKGGIRVRTFLKNVIPRSRSTQLGKEKRGAIARAAIRSGKISVKRNTKSDLCDVEKGATGRAGRGCDGKVHT